MAKFRSWNYNTQKIEYFKNGKYYSDKSMKKEIQKTDYEISEFWRNIKYKKVNSFETIKKLKDFRDIYLENIIGDSDGLDFVMDKLNKVIKSIEREAR